MSLCIERKGRKSWHAIWSEPVPQKQTQHFQPGLVAKCDIKHEAKKPCHPKELVIHSTECILGVFCEFKQVLKRL